MKQFLLLLIVVIPLLSFSQNNTYVSVDTVRTFYWDKNDKPQLFSVEPTAALFKIDTKSLVITFTAKDQITYYYIKKSNYNESDPSIQFQAYNDMGFQWDISLDSKTLMFMGVQDNKRFGILYKVKKTWLEK